MVVLQVAQQQHIFRTRNGAIEFTNNVLSVILCVSITLTRSCHDHFLLLKSTTSLIHFCVLTFCAKNHRSWMGKIFLHFSHDYISSQMFHNIPLFKSPEIFCHCLVRKLPRILFCSRHSVHSLLLQNRIDVA